LTLLDRLLDLLLDVLEVDAEVGEHRGCDALTLANKSEEDVLGADVLVMQASSLLACHLEHPPDPVGEVVPVHPPHSSSSSRRTRSARYIGNASSSRPVSLLRARCASCASSSRRFCTCHESDGSSPIATPSRTPLSRLTSSSYPISLACLSNPHARQTRSDTSPGASRSSTSRARRS